MLLALSVASPACALAPVGSNELCVQAIKLVEPGSGLPPNLLGAIGRVESGTLDVRDGAIKAWPWSVNAEGRGMLFASKPEAMAAVVALQARGVTSIDVGCMQVNLMYHPTAFATLDEAFEPLANVRYAAVFLRALHAETADWSLAAAYYHSRNPERASAYEQKVAANLPGAQRAPAPVSRPSALANAWAATLPDAHGPDGRGATGGEPSWSGMLPIAANPGWPAGGRTRSSARYVAR